MADFNSDEGQGVINSVQMMVEQVRVLGICVLFPYAFHPPMSSCSLNGHSLFRFCALGALPHHPVSVPRTHPILHAVPPPVLFDRTLYLFCPQINDGSDALHTLSNIVINGVNSTDTVVFNPATMTFPDFCNETFPAATPRLEAFANSLLSGAALGGFAPDVCFCEYVCPLVPSRAFLPSFLSPRLRSR